VAVTLFGASPDLVVHSDIFGLVLALAAMVALCVAQMFDVRVPASRVALRRAVAVAVILCVVVLVLVMNRFIVLR
jgi:hypothetical protein